MIAATPPGSRYAATNSSAKNAPMFRAPSSRARLKGFSWVTYLTAKGPLG
ncbi:hypothetical protein BH24ACT9_BH24ACT9_10010 [soil metagenome]